MITKDDIIEIKENLNKIIIISVWCFIFISLIVLSGTILMAVSVANQTADVVVAGKNEIVFYAMDAIKRVTGWGVGEQ